MSTLPLRIAKYYLVSGHNVLFQDHDGMLYISGDNNNGKAVPGDVPAFLTPCSLRIRLASNEKIIAFKSYPNSIYIYTNQQRLISRPATFAVQGNMRYYLPSTSRSRCQLGTERNDDFEFEVEDHLAVDITMDMNRMQRESRIQPEPTNVAPVTRSIISSSWALLTNQDFARLHGSAREEYITQTRLHLEAGITTGEEWTNDEEVVARALEQLTQEIIPEVSMMDDADSLEQNLLPIYKPILPLTLDTTTENLTEYIFNSNVSNVIFGSQGVLYRIGDDLFVDALTVYKLEGADFDVDFILTEPVSLGPNSYRIILPFKPDIVVFKEDMVCMKAGSMYHVIWPKVNTGMFIPWVWFMTDLELDFNGFYWTSSRKSQTLPMGYTSYILYVVHDDIIWRCNYRRLVKYASCSLLHHFSYNENGHTLFFRDNTGLYQDSSSITYIGSYNLRFDTMIQIHELNRDPENSRRDKILVVYNDYDISRITDRVDSVDDVIFVNVANLKYYGRLSSYGFAFVSKNMLYVISSFRTSNSGSVCSSMYYTYRGLPVSESEILSMEFNETLIIRTEYHIYYGFAYLNLDFQTQFITDEMPVPVSETCLDKMIKPHLLVRLDTHIGNNEIKYSSDDSCLDIVIRNMIKLGPDATFSIELVKNDQREAFGSGVRSIFFHNAIMEFSNRYFIKHNHATTFSLVNILSDSFAYIILLCLNNLKTVLPIRLPLRLLADILDREPTIPELEYFARIEDTSAFLQLQAIKDDPEQLETSCFRSYEDALKSICKMEDDTTFIRNVAHVIRTKAKVQTLSLMNMPILDCFFSGYYTFDMERFLSQIRFEKMSTEEGQRILNIIAGLDDRGIASLLFNWSGSTTLSNELYIVEKTGEKKNDLIKFQTCTKKIFIRPMLLQDFPDEMLKSMLVDRCDDLQDNCRVS